MINFLLNGQQLDIQHSCPRIPGTIPGLVPVCRLAFGVKLHVNLGASPFSFMPPRVEECSWDSKRIPTLIASPMSVFQYASTSQRAQLMASERGPSASASDDESIPVVVLSDGFGLVKHDDGSLGTLGQLDLA